MTRHELSKLDLKIDPSEIKVLNDTWIAFFYPNQSNKSEGMVILREKSDGSIAAYENLIDLQDRLPIILPKTGGSVRIDSSYIRHHVSLHHIPKELE